MEDRLEDVADGPKNAKITLSFPLSAAPLPTTLTSPTRCRSSSSSSPSPHRRRPSSKSSDEGSLWKLDATMDIKHRQFKPPRHDSSPSSSPSSSSSPMTVHGFMRKDIKSPPPLKCSKLNPETLLPRSPPRSSNGPLGVSYGVDGWDERHRLANGTASPSAQILFSLGTSAYQRAGDVERREKITGRPAGKVGSPHLSLHPPTLHLPSPIPPPPPPPSEGLTAPAHSSSFPPPNNLKPELICGVCHRLFSSASSLTVHMRLHRGSRALSCRYCGKVFIHSKRLQSHEGSCGVPTRSLLARIQGDDAAAAEILEGDENHFVKVVDGNVIYFCSVCERSYMTLSSLKRHSNVHSWRRRYPCHYCDKVFALAEYRTKHEVWHTGERRYQCIFCWDAFATYYNLKTHQKAIHGINPNLISSEKTANGGYKQKTNALKLYRLLPMRSRKRPYKTYSDSLHNGLLLPPTDTPSLALPGLGCSLSPGDLQSTDAGMPSVITYGHSKPSVIVHGTAMSSSVIVHSNQISPAGDSSLMNSPPSEVSRSNSSQTSHKSNPADEHSADRHDGDAGRLFHKSRKSHGRNEISNSKLSSASAGSQVKEAGPLCQITVRIGEEAIVKRSISETDLRRDKGHTPPKEEEEEEEEEEEMEVKKKKSQHEVKGYYFRQEVREQESDHDTQDNLWRPYYSYKPKRKAQAHLQRVKISGPPLHSPKLPLSTSPTEAPSVPPKVALGEQVERIGDKSASEMARNDDEKAGRVNLLGSNSSPSRLSRRALSRHTCPQCHKVCKTSSALNRHIRRHDLSSSPEREKEDNDSEPKPTETAVNAASADREAEKEEVPAALSVSVISYSLALPTGAAGVGDRPSAHALLLPRAPQPPETEQQDVSSRDSQPGNNTPVSYSAQNYPVPLIVPDSYHSGKKQEESLLMSSYPGALSFGTLGKIMVPNGGDLAKLPFYPDPYQLLYGPQLLAYPYNLAALPVALNMMAPGGDKVEPLPFLPTIFNYAATAGPYMGSAPHPLVANPGLYNSNGGGSKKQRDSSGGKP
uniref:Zinc finger and BTB domain containing 4 n=1 Tax=Takifugu rubripes TaxID=31033 RepID=A0A674MC72_TAKRU